MAHVVVLGAGLGGVPAALELKNQLRREDKVTVVAPPRTFDFTPSNPWVAVGWREPEQIQAALAADVRTQGHSVPQRRLHGGEARREPVEIEGGESIAYDYLVIATGPELAFDEIEGLGPERRLHPVGLHPGPCVQGLRGLGAVPEQARPHRGGRGAGRLLLRAGL